MRQEAVDFRNNRIKGVPCVMGVGVLVDHATKEWESVVDVNAATVEDVPVNVLFKLADWPFGELSPIRIVNYMNVEGHQTRLGKNV